jgi:cytochrome b subunit of formate dehydrogenase
LWLIGLVIGAMALHTTADFVVKLRRPHVAEPPVTLAVPERLSRPLRWQHGLVMLSFPVLVYTGFALTYPESWWAAPLLRWETRFGLRGLIHRIAAVVLVSALVWHAGQWCISGRLRRQLRVLWPSWRDLRDVVARFAYYAGRRPTPPHGTPVSYVEKLEYWAFIWGMLIMTVSGLLLWFSDATLRYLPKWVTDVATAVHFYEAVLATLAIVVWHLYWVIYDPEVYPMDWSWWNGRPPQSRVAERQGATTPEREGDRG